MVEPTVSELGGVDILVNSAAMVGGQVRGTIDDADEKDLIEDLDTKVVGYFRSIKAVVPHMRAKKWGRVISIGGVSARQSTIYGTSQRGGSPYDQDALGSAWPGRDYAECRSPRADAHGHDK